MSAASNRTSLYRLLALSAAYTLVLTPGSLLPMMVSTFISARGLSPDAAGGVLTPELFAIGLVSIVMGVLQPTRVSLRRWMLLGGLLSLAGHAAAMFVATPAAIASVLASAGVGAGLLLYALNTSIAMADHPIREYSIVNSVAVLAPMPLPILIPPLLEQHGAAGSYGLFVAYSLVFAVLLLLMPDAHPRKGAGRAGMGPLSMPKFSALMLAVLLPVTGGLALFAFQDFIGQQLGWTAEQMGTVITISFLGSVIGTGFAAWADNRYGWFAPTVAMIVGLTVSVLVSTETNDRWVFACAAFVFEIFMLGAIPYLLAACARVDASGQVAATGGGVLFLGMALGPYIGGWLVEHQGVPSIGAFMALCAVLSILLALVLRRDIERPQAAAEFVITPPKPQAHV